MYYVVTFIANPFRYKMYVVPVKQNWKGQPPLSLWKPVFGEQIWIVDKLFRIRAFPAHHHHPIVSHLGNDSKLGSKKKKGLHSQ